MTIQINYKKAKSNLFLNNLVLFVDENFNINNLKRYISNSEFEIYFLRLLILKFSSTNRTRLVNKKFDFVFL